MPFPVYPMHYHCNATRNQTLREIWPCPSKLFYLFKSAELCAFLDNCDSVTKAGEMSD